MNKRITKEEIRELVANNDLKDALEALNSIGIRDSSHYNEVIVLNAKLTTLNRNYDNGLIAKNEEERSRIEIAESILDLLGQINISDVGQDMLDSKSLIAKGKIDEVFVLLEEIGENSPLINEISLLKSQYNKLKKATQNGLLSKREEQIKRNKINYKLLSIIDDLEKENQSKPIATPRGEAVKTKQRAKSYFENFPHPVVEDIPNENGKIEVVEDLYADFLKVELVLNDLFKVESDLLVVPTGVDGQFSSLFLQGLEALDLPHSIDPQELAHFKTILNTEKNSSLPNISFVATKDAERYMNLDELYQMGRALGVMTQKYKSIKTIASPLLAAGAPLDDTDIFRALMDGFTETAAQKASLIIAVIDREIYDDLEPIIRERKLAILNPSFSATVPSFQTDSDEGKDLLDITDEVDSFARLITNKSIKPPLSIGIFGDWGSGKSFFMRQLKLKVDEISADERAGHTKKNSQIWFNAWHFVDANLWASLMTKIFDKLAEDIGLKTEEEEKVEGLYASLSSTQILIEETNVEIKNLKRQKKSVQQKISNLDDAIKNKKETLADLSVKNFFNVIKDDKEVEKLLDKADDLLELKHIRAGKEEINTSLEQVSGLILYYRSILGRFIELYRKIFAGKHVWRIFLFVFLICIPFAAPALVDYLGKNNGFFKNITDQIAQLGGIILSITAFIPLILKRVRPALDTMQQGVRYLENAKQKLEHLENIATTKQQQRLNTFNLELSQLLNQKDQAEQKLSKAENDIAKTNLELQEIRKGKRFSVFLERRLQSDNYRKHLGLISIIRKDFELLSAYLQKYNEEILSRGILEELPDQNQVERIVLYIDDLDRCPQEKVIEVLQAIHLILAFPLFVVVVGIDVKWITKSLIKEYGDMLSNFNEETINSPQLQKEFRNDATPFDYLEKIFQLPFRLNRIGDRDKKTYISELLKTDSSENNKATKRSYSSNKKRKIASQSASYSPMPKKEIPPKPLEFTSLSAKSAEETTISHIESDVSFSPAKISQSQHYTPKSNSHSKVQFDFDEIEFIKGLTPILGTSPRTIKRFLNTLRLIKSNPYWVPISSEINTKSLNSIYILLATTIGSPWMTALFLNKLQEAEGSEILLDFVNKTELEIGKDIDQYERTNQEWDNFRHFLNEAGNNRNIDIRAIPLLRINYLKTIIPFVKRFSFRQY